MDGILSSLSLPPEASFPHMPSDDETAFLDTKSSHNNMLRGTIL